MPSDPDLRPASPEEVSDALSHALLYRSGKRFNDYATMQARIAADHLLRALETSGFVLMRKRSSGMHSGAALGLHARSPAKAAED